MANAYEARMMDIGAIKPYPKNPRKNQSVKKVAESLKEFGWQQPIVVDEDYVVIAGHTRLKAAQQLKYKEVLIHVASGLSEDEVTAYRIADNRTAEGAEWEMGLLIDELVALDKNDYDLTGTGFDVGELNKILKVGQDAVDKIPPVPDDPVSQTGDLYLLGKHRLLCGDATSEADVALLFDGVVPNLMVTDPPYGVDYKPQWRADVGVNKSVKKMGQVSNDDRADWSEAWALFPGDVAYCWHAGVRSSEVQASLEAAGFNIRSQIIWSKDRFALSRGHYHWQHEPCWYAVRNKASWSGGRAQSTVWNIKARDDSGHGHGTQKPVECMRRPIENNSSEGQAVYDPFVGSGTTIIAAESAGRVCYAIDVDPAYIDVCVRRWEEYTGKTAELIGGKRKE